MSASSSSRKEKISPYEAIAFVSPSVSAREAKDGPQRVICPLCPPPRRASSLPKNYARGKGLRAHLNTIHGDLSHAELLDALKASEQEGQEGNPPALAPATTAVSTPLDHPGMTAARDGDLEGLRQAVAEGWDPEIVTDRNGSTALLWAAGNGHLHVVRYLLLELEDQAIDPYQVGVRASGGRKDGKTCLHWASRNGRTAVARFLLSAEIGLPVDLPTKDGSTPVMLACFGGHLGLAQVLQAEFQADLARKNRHLCSCAHWAAMGGHVPVLEWLWQMHVPFDEPQIELQLPSHKSAAKRQWDALAWYFHKFQSTPSLIVQKDRCGFTALEIAASQGCPLDLLSELTKKKL